VLSSAESPAGFSGFSIDVAELLKSRRGNHNEARNVTIYFMRKHAGASLKDISSSFGMKSYSSVSSVIMRIKQTMDGGKNYGKG